MSRSRLFRTAARIAVAGVAAVTVAACGTTDDAAPADGGGTRTVSHAMGTTEIAGPPERVVVLDSGELDSVLALGVTPVGAVAADGSGRLQSYLADRTRDVAVVGTIGEPNLEQIAALRPDLILSNKVRHEALYGALSQIAPTVFAERVGVAWKDNLRLAGVALGRPQEAARVLAEYEDAARAAGARYGDPAQVEVSTVRFVGGTVRLYGAGSFIGTVLADAGFARPAAQQADTTFVEVSQEQIGQADADRLFYGAYGEQGGAAQAAVTGGPLWQSVPAVAEGRARAVSDDLWYLGIGPIAANLVLQEL